MINMIILFNEMKILGVDIDGQIEVDMVLETFLDSFRQFKLNYTMDKLMMSLLELIR